MCEDDQGERIAATCFCVSQWEWNRLHIGTGRRFRCEGRFSGGIGQLYAPLFLHLHTGRTKTKKEIMSEWILIAGILESELLQATPRLAGLGLLLGILWNFSLSLSAHLLLFCFLFFASHGSLTIIRGENDGSNQNNVSPKWWKKREKIFQSDRLRAYRAAKRRRENRPSEQSHHTPPVNGYKTAESSDNKNYKFEFEGLRRNVRKWTFLWIYRHTTAGLYEFHYSSTIPYRLLSRKSVDVLYVRTIEVLFVVVLPTSFFGLIRDRMFRGINPQKSVFSLSLSLFYSILRGGGVCLVCRQHSTKLNGKEERIFWWLITFWADVQVLFTAIITMGLYLLTRLSRFIKHGFVFSLLWIFLPFVVQPRQRLLSSIFIGQW